MISWARGELFSLREEEFQRFASGLLPGVDRILGVRIPALRKLAKRIVKEDFRAFLTADGDLYFEERMLQGIVIGAAKMDIEERMAFIFKFVPKIDNWSVCDSFCASLKFMKTHPELAWNLAGKYLGSSNEFEVRFAVVLLLDYLVNDAYIRRVIFALDDVEHDGYYAKMAVAWAISVCYVKYPEITLRYLKTSALDDFTYHKALQKITESRRAREGDKPAIRALRRKTVRRTRKALESVCR